MADKVKWSASSDDPEARELHRRAARARNQLRSMCEDDPYLIVTELEDAVRTLARRPLEEELDRLRKAVIPILDAYAIEGEWMLRHEGNCPDHPDRVRNRGACECQVAEVETAFKSLRLLAGAASGQPYERAVGL